jgi:hypothetical protein
MYSTAGGPDGEYHDRFVAYGDTPPSDDRMAVLGSCRDPSPVLATAATFALPTTRVEGLGAPGIRADREIGRLPGHRSVIKGGYLRRRQRIGMRGRTSGRRSGTCRIKCSRGSGRESCG